MTRGALHPEFSFYTFEEEERDIREQHWNVQEGDVVVDVGASYGSYTLTACAMGAKMVYAFEPERLVYHDLVRNLEINEGFANRALPLNFGLWSELGSIGFETYAPHWPRHTISEPYSMDTLDRIVLLEVLKLDRLDWIKIDVEGAEEQVLLGGAETVRRFHPKMLVECHTFLDPGLKDRVTSLLQSIHPDYAFQEVDRPPCTMLVVT